MDDVCTSAGSMMFYRDKISSSDVGHLRRRTAEEVDRAAAELRIFLNRRLSGANDDAAGSTD